MNWQTMLFVLSSDVSITIAAVCCSGSSLVDRPFP